MKEPYTENTAASFKFRDLKPVESKPPFITRFRCESLQPISGQGLREGALAECEGEKERLQQKIESYMQARQSWQPQKREFVKYYKLADKLQNMSDKKPQQFLDKGSYIECTENFSNLYRGDAVYANEFKLYHRPLKPFDHNLQFGDDPAPSYLKNRY